MWLGRIALTLALCAPLGAAAQQAPLPAGLQARAVALAQACQAVGGQPTNGQRDFLHNMDLTGDGRPDFIMDEAGFACTNRAYTTITPDGAPLEVFDGASGKSLWRGMAYTYGVQPGQPRTTLVVTLRGAACSAGAQPTATCERPLTWDPVDSVLLGAPTLPSAATLAAAPAQSSAPFDPLAGGPQPKAATPAAPAAAPAPAGANAMTLTAADRTAIFRTAGFKQTSRGWERCEDPGSLSYEPGAIGEVTDLNGDGRPEVIVTEGSAACFGNVGGAFVILTREANGAWRKVLDTMGSFTPLRTRANGWQEVIAGGPGFEQPVMRYNGREYVLHRRQRE